MSELRPNSTFGIYHIVRLIGGGGMAKIYLAKTKGLAGFEKHLALKVINEEYANERRFIQMLIDEAKITVGLSHVNIAQVFDLGETGSGSLVENLKYYLKDKQLLLVLDNF